jgi:endonuclease/exonuclease/phosphatase family metal-dependent hydrolase
MPKLRVVSANLEWMNRWFTADPDPVAWRQPYQSEDEWLDPQEAAQRAARMLHAIDGDVIAIQEGPSRPAELQLFVADHLPGYQSFLSASGGQQKLGVLVRNGLPAAVAASEQILSSPWSAAIVGPAVLEPYSFTRPPFVVDVTLAGKTLKIIALHLKSNFINNGQHLWNTDRQAYVDEALRDRRRISTEGMRVRSYLDKLVTADPQAKCLVLGDLNDGPGRDYFEENYLSHNVTDILLGSGFEPELNFSHAQHDVAKADRYTAVFDDFVEGVQNNHLLLDHVLVSPGLAMGSVRKIAHSGSIHHTEWQAQVQGNGGRRMDRPSDHRPVSLQIDY